MEVRWELLIRGIRSPLLEDDKSSTAELLGLVVPMPTCARKLPTVNNRKIKIVCRICFIIIKFDRYFSGANCDSKLSGMAKTVKNVIPGQAEIIQNPCLHIQSMWL